jgi:ATP-dependent DNA helicase RecG
MMQTSPEQLERLLSRVEDCNLEFKKAAGNFDSRELRDYCAALANERGGKLLLGVQQRADKTGEAAGTTAFLGTHIKLSNELLDELGIRVDVEEIDCSGKRILVFHVPSRNPGSVIRSTGKYTIPMRAGESLREMDDLTLKTIMNETSPDFSAQPVSSLTLADLDPSAIVTLRRLCAEHVKNKNFLSCSEQQLLIDLGLMTGGTINYAGIVLLGSKQALDRLLPQAEIVFEWRQIPGKIPHDFRKNWRQSFLTIIDEIWRELESRNIRTPFQQGFIQREVFAFDERSIREAVLNAVTHRDYSITGQVIFITASPDGFLIESPGGFLPGITPENAIYSRAWRNQRLAEVFEKTGLIERSGQGLDLIFEQSIRSGKGLPDLSKSTPFSVKLSIPALLKDPAFILFLEKVTNERQISFSFEEMLELESIRVSGIVSRVEYAKKFLDLGIIEKHGRTKDTRYMLSHAFYAHEGKRGVHTRLAGLKRSKSKELILEHIRKNGSGRIDEFSEAFPELSYSAVQNLLRDLRKEGQVTFEGSKRGGQWILKS